MCVVGAETVASKEGTIQGALSLSIFTTSLMEYSKGKKELTSDFHL